MRLHNFLLLLPAAALCGCAAITSTTNTAARTLEVTSNATIDSTEASQQDDGATAAQARAAEFAESALPMIQRDMAAGEGAHLQALGHLLGESNPAEFGRWAQSHYAELFEDLRTPGQLVDRIITLRG